MTIGSDKGDKAMNETTKHPSDASAPDEGRRSLMRLLGASTVLAAGAGVAFPVARVTITG